MTGDIKGKGRVQIGLFSLKTLLAREHVLLHLQQPFRNAIVLLAV